MPSWNTPSTSMPAVAVSANTGLVIIIDGSPIRNVRNWPIIIAEKRVSPSRSPTAMNIPAMNIPAAMATKFPSMYPGWSWSKKNSAIPKSVKITTSRSALRIFVLYISAVNITINTGEVNCSTIAFAAVVSLFAQVKQVYTHAAKIPAIKVCFVKMNFIREFTVKVVALGALPRNTTSGKIKKLIDKRVL